MKRLLVSLSTLILVSGMLFGCATARPKAPPPPPSARNFQVFWIPANYWSCQGEKRLLEYIDACAAEGVNIGIEMAGWAGSSVFQSEERLAETMRLYEVAVKRCRQRGIWMFNSILNNNSHLTKYGNKGYTFTSVWPQALRLLDCVKRLGPANQMIQPCAETQTADGRKWEQTVLKALPGWALVYNGSGGHPTSSGGWPFFATHPCDLNGPVVRGSLDVDDCGKAILQAQEGYAGKSRPAVVSARARKARAAGAVGYGRYAFKYEGPADKGAIRALKEGAK